MVVMENSTDVSVTNRVREAAKKKKIVAFFLLLFSLKIAEKGF